MWLPLLSWRRDPMDEVSRLMIFLYLYLLQKDRKGAAYTQNIYIYKYKIIINAIKQIRFVDSVVIYKHICIYTCSSWCLQIQYPKDQFFNGTSYQFCFGVLSLPYVWRNLGGIDVFWLSNSSESLDVRVLGPLLPSPKGKRQTSPGWLSTFTGISHVIRNRSSTTSKWWTAKDPKYMFEHIVKQRSMKNLYLPPRKWSWNLKKTPWKGKISTNQHFSVSMWNVGGVILGTYSIHVW